MNSLTEEQLNAAHSPHQYTLVKAVAGSGKTAVLLERYRWLVIVQRVRPETIAMITFTRRAGKEMQQRLEAESLPIPAWVGTLHAWAYHIGRFNMNPYLLIAEPEEKNAVGPDVIHAQDELIYQVASFLHSTPRLHTIKHVLWDEVQDTGNADLVFLEALDPSNVFAVGDPYQAIYGFAGRDAHVMHWLQEQHPGIYPLTIDFRNPPCVAKIAEDLVPVDKIQTVKTDGFCEFTEITSMGLQDIVEAIQEERGGSIAVLVATRRRANSVAKMLGGQALNSMANKNLKAIFYWSRFVMAREDQLPRAPWLANALKPWIKSDPVWQELQNATTAGEAAALLHVYPPSYYTLDNNDDIDEMNPAEFQEWYLDHGWLESNTTQPLTITTIHACKSREWDHVILADEDGLTWVDDPCEKRRLYYVAIKKKKKSLIVLKKHWEGLKNGNA